MYVLVKVLIKLTALNSCLDQNLNVPAGNQKNITLFENMAAVNISVYNPYSSGVKRWVYRLNAIKAMIPGIALANK